MFLFSYSYDTSKIKTLFFNQGEFMLEFHELTYILAIAETGSFSKAAKKLLISQPSLSQYVKCLEGMLGFPLFDRSVKPIKLTHMGEKYVAFARNTLNVRDDFLQSIHEDCTLQSGHLIVGLSFFRSIYYTPRIFPVFKRRYPGITIELFEKPAPEIEKALINATVDLALTNLPVYQNGISYKKLIEEKLLLAIPPTHPLRDKLVWKKDEEYPALDPRHLIDVPFIKMPHNFRLRALSDLICKDAGLIPQIALVTANFGAAQHLVSEGMGVTLTPETLQLAEETQNRPIYATLICNKNYTWPIVIAYSPKRYQTPAMTAFINTALEIFKK